MVSGMGFDEASASSSALPPQQNKFPIPPEFQSELRFSPCEDSRTNDEILTMLTTHRPIASERNIWGFWDTGVMNMPDWQKRNVCDWVRICPGWSVRILDSLPESANHALEYLPINSVPACYRDYTMTGPYIGQHSADFLRSATLFHHGGVWADMGLILFTSFDQICWNKIEDPNTPWNVCAPWMCKLTVGNYFTAARKGDPLIQRWHECFMALWQGRSIFTDINRHPLIANSGIDVDSTAEVLGQRFNFDLSTNPRIVFDYAAQMICWIRVCKCKGSVSDPFNGVEYWKNHVLLIDSLPECMGLELVTTVQDSGTRCFNVLKLSLDTDPETEAYKKAHSAVWGCLARSSFQKVFRAAKLLKTVGMGTLWDLPENRGKDCEPGTFGELLRYGSVNFSQTRQTIRYVQAPEPERTLAKGCVEV